MIKFICRIFLVLNSAVIGIMGAILLMHSLSLQYGWTNTDFTFVVGYDKLVPIGAVMLFSMLVSTYTVIVHD